MITLNTIVYEDNFNQILSDDCWFFKFNSKLISNKTLTVNNITSIDIFLNKVNELKLKHKFDLIYVDENKEKTILNYNLNINETTLGYYYTIPYFIFLDHIKTKYVLNVASDCMHDIFIDDVFLMDSMKELDDNKLCSTTMVAWTKKNKIMDNGRTVGDHSEIEYSKILNVFEVTNEKFNHNSNFTDQFFMGITEKLRKYDYNVDENISKIIYNGPAYGGNSFEKRMAGHHIKTKTYNFIYKGKQYYIHGENSK